MTPGEIKEGVTCLERIGFLIAARDARQIENRITLFYHIIASTTLVRRYVVRCVASEIQEQWVLRRTVFISPKEARLRFHSLLLRTVAAFVTPLTVSAIGIDFCSVPTVVKQFGSPWGCQLPNG